IRRLTRKLPCVAMALSASGLNLVSKQERRTLADDSPVSFKLPESVSPSAVATHATEPFDWVIFQHIRRVSSERFRSRFKAGLFGRPMASRASVDCTQPVHKDLIDPRST